MKLKDGYAAQQVGPNGHGQIDPASPRAGCTMFPGGLVAIVEFNVQDKTWVGDQVSVINVRKDRQGLGD